MMKKLICLIWLLFALTLHAQIDTSPGGGPNGYKVMGGDCANLDPLARILENSFIADFTKKNSTITSNNFFDLLEKISILQTVKSVPSSQSFGKIKLSCNQEDVEDLKKIRDMYKAAAIGDEKCAKHLKDFSKIEVLDRVIQFNEKN